MIRAIVFDFDGVIADSEPLHLRALQQVVAPLGITLDREEYYERYLGYDDVGAFRALAADRGVAVSDEGIRALIAAKSVAYQSMLSSEVLYPGARECVERLAAEYPLGIASGALRHEIEAILQAGDMDRYFRFIVASGETSAGKPAPDPYLRAAALHGLPPGQCVAIEDSRWGIDSARAAGMKCVGITHTYPASELEAADAIVGNLADFSPDLVRGLA